MPGFISLDGLGMELFFTASGSLCRKEFVLCSHLSCIHHITEAYLSLHSRALVFSTLCELPKLAMFLLFRYLLNIVRQKSDWSTSHINHVT